MSPRFDVIVHGATGYMGRLVCRAFLRDSDGLAWAVSGRNESKLRATLQSLKAFPELDAAAIDAVPVVTADSMDEAQLVDMVQQAKVVLSLVGPYKLYGDALVKACAEHGVHYCDLTGETYWIREMIDKYEASAQKSGAKIVPCCGFDSIPSDLTAFVLAESVRRHRKSATSKISLLLTSFKGGIGGATLSSMINGKILSTPAQLKARANPFNLTDAATMEEKERRGLVALNAQAAKLTITKEADADKWSTMFFMTPCNQAIVHRSNYLLDGQYGDGFVYRERLAYGGFFGVLITVIFQLIFGLVMAFAPTRDLFAKLALQPGDGPSESTLQNGYVNIAAYAYDEAGQLAARAQVSGAGDPGYFLTSKMIVECAKCLAVDEITECGKKGGFLTPASAFGDHLRDRFERKHIFKFELENL